jgi:hypothetical protein
MSLEVEEIQAWLIELHQLEAAALISEAELEYRWIDMAFPLSGNEEYHIVKLDIRVPPSIYRGIGDKYKAAGDQVESAIYEISQHKDRYTHIQSIDWIMRLPTLDEVASSPEIEELFNDSSLFDIQRMWTKAKSRVLSDPEGAITAARTMLESICKILISESNGTYTNKDDLPMLYKKAVEKFDLAPGKQTEEQYRKLAGSCVTIMNAIASIRNQESDSHSGTHQTRVLNAKFVVNVAGSLVEFLVGLRNERNVSTNTQPSLTATSSS